MAISLLTVQMLDREYNRAWWSIPSSTIVGRVVAQTISILFHFSAYDCGVLKMLDFGMSDSKPLRFLW